MSLFNSFFNRRTKPPQFAILTPKKFPDNQAAQKQSNKILQSVMWAVEPGTKAERLEEHLVIASALLGRVARLVFNEDNGVQDRDFGKKALYSYATSLIEHIENETNNDIRLYHFELEDIDKFSYHYDYLSKSVQLLLDQHSRSFKNPIHKLAPLIEDYKFWSYCYQIENSDLFEAAAFFTVLEAFNAAIKVCDAAHLQKIGTEAMFVAFNAENSRLNKSINSDCAIRTSKHSLIASRIYQILLEQNKAANKGQLDIHTVAMKAGIFLGEEVHKLCFFPKGEVDEESAVDRTDDIIEKYYNRMLTDFTYQDIDTTSMPMFSVLSIGVSASVDPQRPHIVGGNNVDPYLEFKMSDSFIDGLCNSFDLTAKERLNVATVVADYAMDNIHKDEVEENVRLVMYPAIQLSKVPLMNIEDARVYYVDKPGMEIFDKDRRLTYQAAVSVQTTDWKI